MVYLPGQKLGDGEQLVVDNSAYEMLHQMGVEWPCLSFDILADRLGSSRSTFPMTTYFVAGSQADTVENNSLYIMKLSQLHRTKHDDDSEDSDDDLDEDPILEFKRIHFRGGVNRIRVRLYEKNDFS
jgi:ribosome assembly protein RRB1